jgi:acetyl/propionyl-CoA carboxylase alpha subunit
MFKKILIANRGEIAVRILRACRALNVRSLALFQAADRGSLHVRLADECVQLDAPAGFTDQDAILRIAVEKGADAIHTGYGFLAEREDFVRKCAAAGIAFIGPPADAIERTRQKVDALRRAAEAGYPVPPHSGVIAGDDLQARSIEAELLGYPLVVKSSRGGRGRGERLVWSPERLERLARAAQTEAQAVYDDRFIYLEKVLLPAHQIGVQIVADRFGNRIHLGERDGSMRYGNQKIVEETPAPCLTPAQRAELCQAASSSLPRSSRASRSSTHCPRWSRGWI